MSKTPPRRPQVFDAHDPHVQPSPETLYDDTSAEGGGAEDGGARDKGARDQGARDKGERDDNDRARASSASGDTTAGWRARAKTAPASQPPAEPALTTPERRRRFSFVSAFISAIFLLSSLAIGLWFARFVSVAVARDDWIGWTAKGLALFIAGVIVIAMLREIIGFMRLARLGRLRRAAEQALASGDQKAERRVVRQLKGLVSGRAEYRWALSKFRDEERHQTEAGQLLGLADRVLLAPADQEAKRVIYSSARRVAVVTAVVPMALIAVLFVLFENVRMLRRLAGTYGGRPGMIGGWRLLIRVILHIAATGAIALTDDLFGQFLGQDIIRRLSARLGEGAFNGALTARLGIVAVELTRPCPYIEAPPLRARHVVRELFPEFSAGELIGRAVGRKGGGTGGGTGKDDA